MSGMYTLSILTVLLHVVTSEPARPVETVATSRIVRCTPCEERDRYRPRDDNYVMDPNYRGNGADNLGYDWSPKAWGGPAFPNRKEKDRKDDDNYRGGRQMQEWRTEDWGGKDKCLRCGPTWNNPQGPTQKQGEWPTTPETVTSSPLMFRSGHRISYVPAEGGDMRWDGVSGGGMRWDGFSNGISWITRGAPWTGQDGDQRRLPDYEGSSQSGNYGPSSFKPWDNTGKGSSGWDNSGKGYYFAGGSSPGGQNRPGYASSWQYGSTWQGKDMKWTYGTKPWSEGDRDDLYNRPKSPDRYGQSGQPMFGNYYPSDQTNRPGYQDAWQRPPDKNYLPNDRYDRYPQPRPDNNRPWSGIRDRYDNSRPDNFGSSYPTPRPEYLPQDKYTPNEYGSGGKYPTNTIWNGRPNDPYGRPENNQLFGSSYPSGPNPTVRPPYSQDNRPGSYPSDNRPSGSYPNDNRPSGIYTTSRPSYQGGNRPSGSYPSDNRPSGAYPSDNRPSGSYPSDNRPSGPYPSDNRPSGSYPSDNRPSGPYPSDNRPFGSYPSDNRPSGSYPQDNRPGGTYSQDNRPGGTYSQDNRPYPSGTRPPPKGQYTGFITEINNEDTYGGNKYPTNTRYPDRDNTGYNDRDRYPSSGNRYPSSGDRYPSSGDRYPSSGDRYPSSGDKYPSSGDRYPSSGDGYQSSGNRYPSSGDGYPSSGNRYPSSGDRYPSSGDRYPDRDRYRPSGGSGSGDYDRGPQQSGSDNSSWNYGDENKDGTYRRTGGSYPPYKGGQYYTSSYLASASTPSGAETKPVTKPEDTTSPTSDS